MNESALALSLSLVGQLEEHVRREGARITAVPHRQVDVAADELVHDLGIGTLGAHKDERALVEHDLELTDLPVHIPFAHGAERPLAERGAALGVHAHQRADRHADQLAGLGWRATTFDAHAKVAHAVAGQRLPALDVAPAGLGQSQVAHVHVGFEHSVGQLTRLVLAAEAARNELANTAAASVCLRLVAGECGRWRFAEVSPVLCSVLVRGVAGAGAVQLKGSDDRLAFGFECGVSCCQCGGVRL